MERVERGERAIITFIAFFASVAMFPVVPVNLLAFRAVFTCTLKTNQILMRYDSI